MCSPQQLAEILEAVSAPPQTVRRHYLLLLAEHYRLPSMVEALDIPVETGIAARKARYREKQRDLVG